MRNTWTCRAFFCFALILSPPGILCPGLNAAADEDQQWILSAVTRSSGGSPWAEGGYEILESAETLFLRSLGTKGSMREPLPMYMAISYLGHPTPVLFIYPVQVGMSFTSSGNWYVDSSVSISEGGTIEVPAGRFSECIKHTATITSSKAGSEKKNQFAAGERTLYFAKGVGLVKMIYKHDNGITTESVLTEFELAEQSEAFLPLSHGNQWKYQWKNGYRKESAVETWTLSDPDEKQSLTAVEKGSLAGTSYKISILGEARRLARVQCTLVPKDSKKCAIPLRMDHAGAGHYPDGYAHYMHDLAAVDEEGRRLAIAEIDEARWSVQSPDGKPVRVGYTVLLNHDNDGWTYGPDEAPYAKEDCVFWTGRSLFIVPDVRTESIEVEFDVPDAWKVSTQWKPVSGRPRTFHAADPDDLTDCFLALGTYDRLSCRSGNMRVTLAVGGECRPHGPSMREKVEGFLDAYARLFSGSPEGRMLIVANPHEKKHSLDGGVFGNTISLLIPAAYLEREPARWVPFIGHELFHLWNGRAVEAHGQEYWFSEGFTEYYADVFSVRLGYLSEGEFIERLERACRSYLSVQGALSIRDAGRDKSSQYAMVYKGGQLLAFLVDVSMRHESDNRISLDALMERMYEEFGAKGKKYAYKDVLRLINDISGKDCTDFFRRYVIGKERLPLEEYMARAGLELSVTVEEEMPELSFVVFEMLRIMSLSYENMLIKRSQEAGFLDGDRLLAIDGEPMKEPGDLQRFAGKHKPGDEVSVTIMRNGESMTMPLTLGGEGEEVPVERKVQVRLKKSEKVTGPLMNIRPIKDK